MAKILLVEDDIKLSGQMKAWLEHERHVVEVATAGDDALDRLRHYYFDLIILDWMLPGMEGIEVCRRLRERGLKIPVLMISGKGATTDKTTGLDGGADDYLTKPVDPKELSARIRALLRRPLPPAQEALQLGDLYLDPASLTVRKGGASILLQPKEIHLLALFMRHPNELLAVEFILEHIWPSDPDASAALLKTYIHKLRSNFDQSMQPLTITAVYGKGYMLKVTDESK